SGDVWMQPGSQFQVTGLSRGDLFFKRAFDRYGVRPDYEQRGPYKTAVNPYLYSDYTAAHRTSELSWMGSVYEGAVADAAQDRGRPAAALKTALEGGPYGAEDAKATGLIDQVGQLHDAGKALLARAGRGARLMAFADYADRPASLAGGEGGRLAVISAEGAIMTGKGRPANPLGGEDVIRSDEVSRSFYAAIEDRDVRGIVFRISSPGGSDTASEQILAAVRAARAAGKPVVVSMGAYGASGGYWIASQASEIVAEPGTLTGSIGVFGGKFALGEAVGRFGIDMRHLKVGGDYADALGSDAPMTASQRAAFAGWIDRIYDEFIARVAAGRRMTPDQVRAIAGGRVWTGAQAKALGLVDRLGGFYDAVERARALAGIRGEPELQPFDVGATPFDAARRLLGTSVEGLGLLASVAETPGAETLARALADARLRAEGATVLAPEPY
ncbi:MAG: signal peptide peptidase SppA, partial [Caulobacteraceae bacterium]|nr:signal peptide peptidase SppA [Caulobacteraceae bacterium]